MTIDSHEAGPPLMGSSRWDFLHICGTVVCSIDVLFHLAGRQIDRSAIREIKRRFISENGGSL
jgi:hypothetical protein